MSSVLSDETANTCLSGLLKQCDDSTQSGDQNTVSQVAPLLKNKGVDIDRCLSPPPPKHSEVAKSLQ